MSSGSKQLKLLKIDVVVSLTPEKPVFKDEFEHFHVEVDEKLRPTVDFDEIYDKVVHWIDNEHKTVFVFDLSGQVASAFAIKYFWHKNKHFPKDIATASVMNKRFEVKDMPGWLFMQIQDYKTLEQRAAYRAEQIRQQREQEEIELVRQQKEDEESDGPAEQQP